MMSIFSRIRAWLNDSIEHDAVLDHVPVGSTVNAKKFARLRKKAQERHGKPFATDARKPRETPPSDFLRKLEPKPQDEKVRKIK